MALRQQGRNISEEEAQKMYNVKSRLFHQMHEAPMMPGALQLMAQIHADGKSIGVVTGSGQIPLIERLLNDYGNYVDRSHIVTAYDVKQGKPHPDPYLQGLVKMGGLQPFEAIVVENAPLGVEAAVAAGIFTICVNSGHLPSALFQEKGADIIIDSMEELCITWPLLQAAFSNHRGHRQ